MTMTKAGLKAQIVSKVSAKFDIQSASILDDFADAVADAIITYITANGVCTITGVATGGLTKTGTIT